MPEDAAAGELVDLYQADVDSDGFVGNMTKAFSLRPEALRAWEQLSQVIRSDMDLRRDELATLAAARRLRSSCCSLAHGQKVLAAGILDADQLRDVVTDATSVTEKP